MARTAYVNGRYVPMRNAMVHVEDRGYQFADGGYEVCEVRGGRLIDERRHLDRLERSLAALRIRMPLSRAALGVVLREVVARNRIGYGIAYLQITRGVARRDHAFPSPEVAPSLVVTARRLDLARNEALAAKGISVRSAPDNRWGRVDIKTVGLLPNVLARQDAIDKGARDAWFVDAGGTVTEASLAAPGPSSYFADRTLKAAQLWKFTPAKLDGRNVPSDWLLRFEIDPASTNVYPAETAP